MTRELLMYTYVTLVIIVKHVYLCYKHVGEIWNTHKDSQPISCDVYKPSLCC